MLSPSLIWCETKGPLVTDLCCYRHTFLKKKSQGDVVIAVMLSPPKPFDEIQPNLVCELLT